MDRLRPAPFSLYRWHNRQIQSGSLGLTRRQILLWSLTRERLETSYLLTWELTALSSDDQEFGWSLPAVRPWPGVFPSTSVCAAFCSSFLVLWVPWLERWFIFDTMDNFVLGSALSLTFCHHFGNLYRWTLSDAHAYLHVINRFWLLTQASLYLILHTLLRTQVISSAPLTQRWHP